MRKLKVAVLMGGKSSEYEISLATGENVVESLDKNKYQVKPIIITKRNRWTYQGRVIEPEKALKGINIVFNAMHGQYGEDGTVQGILEFLGVPYTGSDVLASALAMNKIKSRELFRLNGLLTPPSLVLNKFTWLKEPKKAQKIIAKISLPAVVKPSNLGSSVNVFIARKRKEFKPAFEKIFKTSDNLLLEKYLDGLEVTCGVLENFKGQSCYALPVTEIVPPAGHFFDYQVKYDGQTQEITPARIDRNLTKKIQRVAQRAHQILGCRGYSRADIIVKNRKVYLLEVNTLPGLTRASLVPRAAQVAGLEFPQFLDKLIGLALGRDK